MTGVDSNDPYDAAGGYPGYRRRHNVDIPTGPRGPDPSCEPVRTTTTVIARPTWDAWVHNASVINRTAKRTAVTVAIVVGGLSTSIGIAVLPPRFLLTAALYAPLVGWGAGYLTRSRIRRRKLKQTIAQMRQTLAPNQIGQFESQVLGSILTSHRVPAGRESRLVLVEDAPLHDVKLSVIEYDMSKIEPTTYPSAGGG